MKNAQVNNDAVKRAVLTFRAVNHKLRQQIIDVLQEAEANGQKITVTDLYIKLRLEQSVASQHLAILRRADVVVTERNGKFIYYRVKTETIEKINRVANDLTVK